MTETQTQSESETEADPPSARTVETRIRQLAIPVLFLFAGQKKTLQQVSRTRSWTNSLVVKPAVKNSTYGVRPGVQFFRDTFRNCHCHCQTVRPSLKKKKGH